MTYISAQVTENKQSVIVWERAKDGTRDYKVFRAPYYFYYPDALGVYVDSHGKKLSKLEFSNSRDFFQAKEEFRNNNISLYESDIGPEYKILAEHYYNKPTGRLNVTFFDIENDYDPTIGYATMDNPYAPISAVSMYHQYNDTFVIYAVPPTPDWTTEKVWEVYKANNEKYANDAIEGKVEINICRSERELLLCFLAEIENTDVLSGWNSAWFDVPYMYFRIMETLGPDYVRHLSFPDAKPPRVREVEKFKKIQKTVDIYGRVSLDYLEVFIKLEQEKRPSNSLEAIAEELVPDLKKLEYDGSLASLYRNDFPFFLRYSIRDTEILKGLDLKLKYIQFAINFSHAATGLPENILGTIKLTELAIINHCHHQNNTIVPDTTPSMSDGKYLGAFVLDPQVGMHDYVSAVDVKSLYPSTMRALNISPECIIGQFMEKNRAYEAFMEETNDQITLLYENGISESYTPVEWKKVFADNCWCISGFGTVFSQKKKGFINDILTDWFNKRIEYQGNMKKIAAKMKTLVAGSSEYHVAEEEYDYFDKLQYIYKIRLNSIYGCVGNQYFKFYDVRMAESVTRTGREILMHMVRKSAEILDGEYAWPSESTIYSDTDSLYFKTHTNNEQDALQVARILCKQVNASFQPFMKKAFMCQPEYDSLISAEQEIVAKRAIFVTKKMYIMHLINKDGKSIDKMKIMGHQVRKTIIPKKISKRLIPYIEMIMNDVPWSDIGKQMVAYKDELIASENLMDIGRPIGIKNIEDYTDQFQLDKKARLPGHVSAAIFWNKCLDDHKDKSSPRIISGMKIKTFYLRKDFGRFRSIAVPDMKRFPDWFVDEYMPLIDRKMQVEKLVDNTMENILDAIGKKMPTKKSLFVDELVEY